MKKKGVLPPVIQWSGTGLNGEPLRVGYDYSYSFSIVDEAGNPQRFAGKPFRLNSFRHTKGGGFNTALEPTYLFGSASSMRLAKDGVDILTEVKDSLRGRYGRTVSVIAYDDDQRFADARAQAVRDFLFKELNWPEDKITSVGLTLKQGKDYKRVDVIAK